MFEERRSSTNTYDINTAAVLLEVAAFQLRGGRPLIEPADDIIATHGVTGPSPPDEHPAP